jgi:uroporphyrin-3 C-methyltransferase
MTDQLDEQKDVNIDKHNDENKISLETPKSKKMIRFIIVDLIIIALLGGGYAISSLYKQQNLLTKSMNALQMKTAEFADDSKSMKSAQQAMSELTTKTDDLIAQQDKLKATWQDIAAGNVDQWYVAEANYLVKMANDQLQWMNQRVLAISLLKRADDVLQKIKNTNVVPIRQSLANDLAKLESLAELNINDTYARLNTLSHNIIDMPIVDSLANIKKDQHQLQTKAADTSSWRNALDHAWLQLQQVIVIRRVQPNELPLIMPDEKSYLYQNLNSQIENAMWGLLHHDERVYQLSLERAHKWTERYFVADDTKTKSVIQEIAILQKVDVQPTNIDFSITLQLFDAISKQTS